MTIEDLKDAIRMTFPDSCIKNALDRMKFILIELSHAYINIIKEVIKKFSFEEFADETKYIVGYIIPAVLIIWWIL